MPYHIYITQRSTITSSGFRIHQKNGSTSGTFFIDFTSFDWSNEKCFTLTLKNTLGKKERTSVCNIFFSRFLFKKSQEGQSLYSIKLTPLKFYSIISKWRVHRSRLDNTNACWEEHETHFQFFFLFSIETMVLTWQRICDNLILIKENKYLI